jgi:signal transduction histidine kinase
MVGPGRLDTIVLPNVALPNVALPDVASPEEAWRRVAAALGSFTEGADIGLLATSVTGTVLAFNEALTRIWSLARTPPEVTAFLEQIAEQLVPADAACFVARVLEDNGNRQHRITRRDGQAFEWWSTSFPSHEKSIRLWLVRAGLGTNLGEALRTAEARLEVFSSYVDGIVFELDADGRYVSVWTKSADLLARPSDDLIGRTLVEVLGDSLGTYLTNKLQEMARTGIGERLEYVIDVPSGRRWFTADPMLRPKVAGRPQTFVFLVRDVTEQKKMQARLLQAERLASIGTLAAGVGHEINNPLGYLILNLQTISSLLPQESGDTVTLRRQDLSRLTDAVRMAREGAEHVRKIVQDLRSFSRAEPAPRGGVDVRMILDFSLTMAICEPPPGLHVATQYGNRLLVDAPEGRLVQLFVNLLTNAVEAMPTDRIDGNEISVVARREGERRVVVEVRDNGRGIPPDLLGHVFDPFFTTKPGVGTGLGLSICYHIVTTLNGEISVESNESSGTLFRVSLPATSSSELGSE